MKKQQHRFVITLLTISGKTDLHYYRQQWML